jgi:hypothetical protein
MIAKTWFFIFGLTTAAHAAEKVGVGSQDIPYVGQELDCMFHFQNRVGNIQDWIDTEVLSESVTIGNFEAGRGELIDTAPNYRHYIHKLSIGGIYSLIFDFKYAPDNTNGVVAYELRRDSALRNSPMLASYSLLPEDPYTFEFSTDFIEGKTFGILNFDYYEDFEFAGQKYNTILGRCSINLYNDRRAS